MPTVSGGGLVVYEGGLSPGNSTAAIQFSGSVAFGPHNTLSMEVADRKSVGGPVPYDQLAIRRDLTLDGTLDLIFVDEFAPRAGDTFELLNATGSIQGQFSEVNIINLKPGFRYTAGWERNVFRLTALNDGIFQLEHPLLPGDFSGNGMLDIDDIDLLAATIRAEPGDTFFDLNADERVDPNDLTIWVRDLRKTPTSATLT